MAIRIRKVNGTTVALCAAKTSPKKNDLYLDDSMHHALSTKFYVDWIEEGLITYKGDLANPKVKKLMLDIERKSK